MLYISLSKVPNQSMYFIHGDYTYDFSFRTIGNLLYATISINGTAVKSSLRCVPYGWLIPYNNEIGMDGNFRFETINKDYPDYNDFDDTCFLVYYTNEEIEAL